MTQHRSGIVPYLFCEDARALADWYVRVFGFEELSSYPDDTGRVRNAELKVGDTELWLDGGGPPGGSLGEGPPVWIGVWVDDPDVMVERIREAGVAIDAPEDKPYGVRMTGSVTDPAGYRWGFMRRAR
jgi:PhnB protein